MAWPVFGAAAQRRPVVETMGIVLVLLLAVLAPNCGGCRRRDLRDGRLWLVLSFHKLRDSYGSDVEDSWEHTGQNAIGLVDPLRVESE